jgi:hypothetical protein
MLAGKASRLRRAHLRDLHHALPFLFRRSLVGVSITLPTGFPPDLDLHQVITTKMIIADLVDVSMVVRCVPRVAIPTQARIAGGVAGVVRQHPPANNAALVQTGPDSRLRAPRHHAHFSAVFIGLLTVTVAHERRIRIVAIILLGPQ